MPISTIITHTKIVIYLKLIILNIHWSESCHSLKFVVRVLQIKIIIVATHVSTYLQLQFSVSKVPDQTRTNLLFKWQAQDADIQFRCFNLYSSLNIGICKTLCFTCVHFNLKLTTCICPLNDIHHTLTYFEFIYTNKSCNEMLPFDKIFVLILW